MTTALILLLDVFHVAVSFLLLVALVGLTLWVIYGLSRPVCTQCRHRGAAPRDHMCLDCRLAQVRWDEETSDGLARTWTRNNLEDGAA